jgi:S1-C subfamily serine protease
MSDLFSDDGRGSASDLFSSSSIERSSVGLSSVAESAPTPPADEAPPTSAAAAPAALPTARRSSRLFWLLTILVVVAALRFSIAPMVEEIQYALERGKQRAQYENSGTLLADVDVSRSSLAFRLVAQRAKPSVVHIETRSPSKPPAQGTGIILDADGYVLTNNHVVEHADQIEVRLSDGRRIRQPQVVGQDPHTDLAVLKLDADHLLPAAWGDSNELEVGDWVVAVGNPFGLDGSVSQGIVSAKNRRQRFKNSSRLAYQDFIQTDAAVNPGNSGGPLLNLRGEVVGINTAIVGEQYQGVGFAIPSEIARDIFERLKKYGQVDRGGIQVSLEELSPDDAASLNLPANTVRIGYVPIGAAQRAGLRPGDIVLTWNGEPVKDTFDLRLKVSRSEIGATARIKVLRDGQEMELEIVVGRLTL